MTIELLNLSIKKMADTLMVGQDIFYELLFQEAVNYYCNVYYPALTGKPAVDAWIMFEDLGGMESVRPKTLNLNHYTKEDLDEAGPEGDYLSIDMLGHGALKLEAILAYFNQCLLEKSVAKNKSLFSDQSGLICGDGPHIEIAFIPIDALINKLLNSVLIVEKIQKLMLNPINKRAYASDFEAIEHRFLIESIDSAVEDFKINTRYCDVFELSLFDMFSNSTDYPSSSVFADIKNHYAKNKIGFIVSMEASEANIDEIVTGINKTGSYIAIKEAYDNGKGTFFIEYKFAFEQVIPRINESLKNSEKLLAVCKAQYKKNIEGKPRVLFYNDYYPKESEKPRCLLLG